MQPSELAKLGLLLVLAQVLGSDRRWPRRLATALLVAALPIGLVLVQPDLSTAAVLCAVTGTMLVLGRIPLRLLVPFLVAAVLVLPFAVHLLHPYQQERLQRLPERLDRRRTAPAGRSSRCTSPWPGAA